MSKNLLTGILAGFAAGLLVAKLVKPGHTKALMQKSEELTDIYVDSVLNKLEEMKNKLIQEKQTGEIKSK